MSETRAKNAKVWKRDELDWYVEPIRASRALFRVERFVDAVWDPSCGQGNIVQAARDAGYEAHGSDLVFRGAPCFAGVRDFLSGLSNALAPNIVCNPPFRQTEDFIRHAQRIALGKIAMFVPLGFLGSERRADGLFSERPPDRVYVLAPRVSCPPGEYLLNGGKPEGGTSDWIWLVLDQTAPPSPTTMSWLKVDPEERGIFA